jgi:VanZ family protein
MAAAVAPVVWLWPDRVRLVAWFGAIDKWMHGITFAVLALWFSGQYRRDSYWRIAVGLIAFGLLIELCQRMVSYRSSEWFDVAANTAGIIVGLAIATAGVGGWSLRFESWLNSRRA